MFLPIRRTFWKGPVGFPRGVKIPTRTGAQRLWSTQKSNYLFLYKVFPWQVDIDGSSLFFPLHLIDSPTGHSCVRVFLIIITVQLSSDQLLHRFLGLCRASDIAPSVARKLAFGWSYDHWSSSQHRNICSQRHENSLVRFCPTFPCGYWIFHC